VDEADTPHEVLCWSCGARRKHPRAAARPRSFQLEAMHHYATRREGILRHRWLVDALALALVLAAGAAGGAYLLRG
jgi:hypothetical protein